MNQRSRRSPARFLGPLAVIAVVVAFFAVVSGSSHHSGGSTSTNVGSTQTTKKGHSTKTSATGANASKPAGPKYYVVKIGDSFSSIADKTGVTLERLQELNPAVDSNQMTAGQKIKLR